MKAIRKAMAVDVVSTIAYFSATIVGVLIDGALGALWGVAIAESAFVVVWWLVLVGQTRSDAPLPDPAGVEGLPIDIQAVTPPAT
jgi:hypothetical protein